MAANAYKSLLPDEINIPLLDDDFDDSFMPRTASFDEIRDIFLLDRD